MAVFITGDVHGDIDIFKLEQFFKYDQPDLHPDDVLIVAGDFGCPWEYPESPADKKILKFYQKQKCRILFVDGNHENFEALARYPSAVFQGASCHRIRKSVLHIKRGEVIGLEDHKILCMGGAMSVDRKYRIEHLSWWRDEIPNEAEWVHAEENLLKEKPDIVITHDAPLSILRRLYDDDWYRNDFESPVASGLEHLLGLIREKNIPVTDWYFGHHHTDRIIRTEDITFHALYDGITQLSF